MGRLPSRSLPRGRRSFRSAVGLSGTSWHNDSGSAHNFACDDDLADLTKIHPPWTFERELKFWGITEIKPTR